MKSIWMYTRRRSTDAQLTLQVAAMNKSMNKIGGTAVGFSQDEGDDGLWHRPGLRQALAAVKAGKADAVMVSRLENISKSDGRRRRFLKKLNKYGGVLFVNATRYKGTSE